MQATPKSDAPALAGALPQTKTPTVAPFAVTTAQSFQIPRNHDEMMGLVMQRHQLNEQLDQVTERRDNIIEQLRSAPEPAQKGLQDELNLLDARVIQIQTQLATVGNEISQASPPLITMAEEPSTPRDDQFGSGVAAGVGGTFAVMSILFFFGFRRWRRSARKRAPHMLSADSERLQRLEQGMEAVAIEVERISEGQRFVTKLLSESRSTEPLPR